MQYIGFLSLMIFLCADASIHPRLIQDDVRYSTTSNQAAQQGQPDPNLIKTCHVCSLVGSGQQCPDERKVNCSMGYTCYKYDGTYNGQSYVEKGCLAFRYAANGCYVISRSEHEPFVGTKCFCDESNFCNMAILRRSSGFLISIIFIIAFLMR